MTPLRSVQTVALFSCLGLLLATTSFASKGQTEKTDIRNVARAPTLEESRLGHERGVRKTTVGDPFSESSWLLWEANMRQIVELERKGVMRVDTMRESPETTAEDELQEMEEINRLVEEVTLKAERLRNHSATSSSSKAVEETLGVLKQINQEKAKNFVENLHNTNFSSTIEAKYLRRLYQEAGMPVDKIEKQIRIDAGSLVEEDARSASFQRTHVLFAAMAAAKRRYEGTGSEDDSISDFVSFSSDYWTAYQAEIQDWLHAPYLGSENEVNHLLDFPIDVGYMIGPGTMDYANKHRTQLSLQQLRIQEQVRKYNPLPKSVQTTDSVHAITTKAQMTKLFRDSLLILQKNHKDGVLSVDQYQAQKRELTNELDKHYERVVGAEYGGPSPLDWASLEDNLHDMQKRSMQAQKEDRKKRMEKLNLEQRRQMEASEERIKRQSFRSSPKEEKRPNEELEQLRLRARDILRRGGSAVDESSTIRHEAEQHIKQMEQAISKKAAEFKRIFNNAWKEN
eukprot:gb/GECG01013644.1/.p1 GENE.gb/GECG01013644.1/~~gb/GECG01013644.1/.p1  ORF type:complete len:512 (+),score=79.92 gb/GECG01013644.1/:1-1536(+)